ncbi:hypothetical protein [Pseudomonas gozinkensis]|uniref:hypothetical protein n=1 Tax=Pseudomonas gozinkensis TaxID=2774461 RepID=UPI0017877FD1|nr:hypothetical protein [Pseudomonas gozinkensis]
MKRIILWMFVLLLSGCATHEPSPKVDSDQGTSGVQSAGTGILGAGTGPEIAAYLTKAYHDKINMCRNNPSAPPFLCSGVLFRATENSTLFHFWDPRPGSTGVSFSWLRVDAKFNKLVFGYNNGFIFYPYFFKPAGKIEPEILCFFPVDGATLSRPDKGCGQVPNVPTSVRCQTQGINTAAQYLAHYNNQPGKYGSLCGFDVRDYLNQGATTAFNEAVKAQEQGGTFAFNTQNEFRLDVWGQNLGATLPIEAVFYLNDTGKAGAQYDQRDFKTQTGIWIPMIRMTLPQTPAADATFQFIPADQAISS